MANPYQTRPYNKYQLIDEIRTANHELEQNRRLRAAAPTAAEAAYYQLQAHEAAVRLNALRTQLRQMAHRVITEEDVLNADHAIVNAERQIAHAVRRIVDEQATPDGVSAGAISALEAARAAHQVASDAHSEMQTLPGYWRHQLESRRQYAPFTNDDQIARAALERAQHTWDTLASLYADEFDPD
jgi:hypothetical protein